MLKSKLTKDEHAALPDAVKEHYKAEGDAFILDADGLVSKADLDAANAMMNKFRDHNRELNTKAEELNALKTKFKDVDPVEYTRVKGELEALKTKGITKPDDVTVKVKEAVKAELKPMVDKLAEAEQKRQESDAALKQSQLRSALKTAALEGKATKEAAYTVVDRAIEVFDLDEHGTLKAKEDYYSADKPTEAITIGEWMTTQAKGPLKFAFEVSKGGGAGEPGGGTPQKKRTVVVSKDNPMVSDQALQDVAAGKAEVSME